VARSGKGAALPGVEHAIGKYIISDKPMTEAQWAAERATIIDDVVEELPAPGK
jgi:hypothetical protein